MHFHFIYTRKFKILGQGTAVHLYCVFEKKKKYNVNSVTPHNVLASDYLTDCHQSLFFQQNTLVYQ